MPILTLFLFGFIAYVTQALIVYSSNLREVPTIYYSLALITGITTLLSWMSIARATEANLLLRYALAWDVMIVLVYLAVPLVLGKAHLSRINLIGLCLLLVGLILTKVGDVK